MRDPLAKYAYGMPEVAAPSHPHITTGEPCTCPWGKAPDARVLAKRAPRTASKIDWLRERNDKFLRTPEGQNAFDSLEYQVRSNPKLDDLAPWLWREIKKGRIQAGGRTFYANSNGQVRAMPLDHIADWFGSNSPTRRGVDIMQLDVDGLDERMQAWDDELAAKMEQERQMNGTVVHDFTDPTNPDDPRNGWTVRRIDNQEQASNEGDAMGHCVGGYGHDIENGTCGIFSLRDPKNQPHATIETRPGEDPQYDDVPHPGNPNRNASLLRPEGSLVHQIQGKQNMQPEEHYKDMLRDWFAQVPGLGANIQKTNVPAPRDPDELRYWHEPEHDYYDQNPYQISAYDAKEYGLHDGEDDFEYEGNPDWHKVIDSYLNTTYHQGGHRYEPYEGDDIRAIAHDTGQHDEFNQAVEAHRQDLAKEFYRDIYDPRQHSGTAPTQWNQWPQGARMNTLLGFHDWDKSSLPYDPQDQPLGGPPVEIHPDQQKLFNENPYGGAFETWNGGDKISPLFSKAAADMRNPTFYHVAPTAARDSIMQQGLIGHTGENDVESPWADLTGEYRHLQPHGNYLFQHPEQAMEYAYTLKYKHPDRWKWEEQEPNWEDTIDYDHPCEHCNPSGDPQSDEDYDHISNCYHCNGMGYKTLEQKPEWDIWKVHVNPDKQLVKADPESGFTSVKYDPQHDDPELSQAEALHRFDKDYDWEHGEYEGDRTPMRWYTPQHVPPEQLELHRAVMPSEIGQYPDDDKNEEWSSPASEQEVPSDFARVPFNRYWGKRASMHHDVGDHEQRGKQAQQNEIEHPQRLHASEPTGGRWSLYEPNPDGSVRDHTENPFERYSPNWAKWLEEREQHDWETNPGTLQTTYKDMHQWVPTDYLAPMLGIDRNVDGNPNRVKRIHDSIKQVGFKEPVWVDFNPNSEMAHVSEGNHKLTAAIQHGIPSVPVMVMRSQRQPLSEGIERHHKYIGGETDHLGQPRPPQYMSPSDIGMPTVEPTPPWAAAKDPRQDPAGSPNMEPTQPSPSDPQGP